MATIHRSLFTLSSTNSSIIKYGKRPFSAIINNSTTIPILSSSIQSSSSISNIKNQSFFIRSQSTVSSSSPSSSSTSSSSSTASSIPSNTTRGPRDVPASTEQRLDGFYYDPTIRLSRRQKQVFSKVTDEPQFSTINEHGYLYNLQEKDFNGLSDMVKRALSTRTGTADDLRSFQKLQLIKKYETAPYDTGSSRVQLVTLTERINRLSAHLERNKHDTHSKRQLLILVSRRRRVMRYMIRKDYHSYRVMLNELNLRSIPVFGSKHTPKERIETHQQINERNKRLKNRKSRGDRGH